MSDAGLKQLVFFRILLSRSLLIRICLYWPFWIQIRILFSSGSRCGSYLDLAKFFLTFFQFLFICFNKHTFKCTKKSNFKHARVYSDPWGQLCIQTLTYFTSFGFSQMQGKSEHQIFHLKSCTFGAKSLLLVFRAKSTIVGTLIYSKKLGEIGRGIILKWCWTRQGVRIYPIIRYLFPSKLKLFCEHGSGSNCWGSGYDYWTNSNVFCRWIIRQSRPRFFFLAQDKLGKPIFFDEIM